MKRQKKRKMRIRLKRSPLLENAVDSLGVGIRFFLDEKFETAKKHAILMVFHSMELLLKEQLRRINPILMYRDIDKKITDDSFTVGLKEILARLENLGRGLPAEEKAVLGDLQRRRNIIEHHRYDPSPDDAVVIGKALRFITWFITVHLRLDLERVVEKKLLKRVLKLVLDYKENLALADHELEQWIVRAYAKDGDDPKVHSAAMDRFPGTVECPKCKNEMLVMGFQKRVIPITGKRGGYCFYCREEFDVAICDSCGRTFLGDEKTPSPCCGMCAGNE